MIPHDSTGQHTHTHSLVQWPFQDPIDWRYLPYIRPMFEGIFFHWLVFWPCLARSSYLGRMISPDMIRHIRSSHLLGRFQWPVHNSPNSERHRASGAGSGCRHWFFSRSLRELEFVALLKWRIPKKHDLKHMYRLYMCFNALVLDNWLVVWNHGILWFSIYWEWKIIPTDKLDHFSEG